MKQLIRLTGLLVLALLTACTADRIADDTTTRPESNTTKMTFTVAVPDYALETRAAVKGVEGIDDNTLEILCFDSDGFYLGLGEEISNEANTSGDTRQYRLSALVPNATARIHFLANSGIDYQASWIGMHENTLMTAMVSNAEKTKRWYTGDMSRKNRRKPYSLL